MSIKAMQWAWSQETKSSGERLVLLALADHAGEDGECWPSTGRIADKCAMHERTVRHHIDSLDERGVISKHERRRRKDGTLGTWLYILNLDQRVPVASGDSQPVATCDRTTGDPLPVVHRVPMPAHEPSLLNPHEPTVICVPESDDFDLFWNQYPRKTSKSKAVTRWRNMTREEKRRALEALPLHVAYWHDRSTDAEFIPHPSTWLNGKRWEDVLKSDWEAKPKGKADPVMDHLRRRLEDAHRGSDQDGRAIGRVYDGVD